MRGPFYGWFIPTCELSNEANTLNSGRGDMRVAVMAAGAVGGYFGARIAAAGHNVAFIARGAHRDAIHQNGLKIESALGELHLNDVNVTDDPKHVGPVDVVLFAVKLWDTETAGEQTRPLVGSNTRLKCFGQRADHKSFSPPSMSCRRCTGRHRRPLSAAINGLLQRLPARRERARVVPLESAMLLCARRA